MKSESKSVDFAKIRRFPHFSLNLQEDIYTFFTLSSLPNLTWNSNRIINSFCKLPMDQAAGLISCCWRVPLFQCSTIWKETTSDKSRFGMRSKEFDMEWYRCVLYPSISRLVGFWWTVKIPETKHAWSKHGGSQLVFFLFGVTEIYCGLDRKESAR